MIKNRILAACAFALAIAFHVGAHAQEEEYYNEGTIRPTDIPRDAPRFDSYPAAVYAGVNAKPRLDPGEEYRTRIRQWAVEKPNFAGHYILANWGCGTECLMIVIIDAKTGKVFHPGGVMSVSANQVHDDLMVGEPKWPNTGPLKFRANSRLLVLLGAPEEDEKRRGISYFVWRNDELSLVRFVPKAWKR